MGKIVIDWLVLSHNVIPFAAAQLFLVVLIYFTLVRERIAQEYPFYAIFLVCFILYLTATLVNILPIQTVAIYLHYASSLLLFSLGFPSLVVALFMQSKIQLRRHYAMGFYLIGLLWALFYFITTDYRTDKINILSEAGSESSVAQWINFDNVFIMQSFVIVVMLILPGLYLLYRKPQAQAKTYVYGMLSLAFFAFIGCITKFWGIYYLGSSVCALTWAWAMFKDIRKYNEQINARWAYEKTFASVQFAAQNRAVSIAELYPESLDESYPFREREALLEAIQTASVGLLPERVTHLITALEQFSQDNPNVFKTRIREVLYLLVDTCIHLGGNAKALIINLEKLAADIDQSNNKQSIIERLTDECLTLIKSITVTTRTTSVDALVERIKTYVLANYHKEGLTIDNIAVAIGVSRSHAMKSFQKKQGITLNQYIINTRMNKAKSYLLEKSVTETAYEVGFTSVSYFSTFFRKHTGIAPTQYQQQARGEQ